MIIEIILRATKMTQGELADYLDVSRASINAWRQNSSSMTESSKKLIADKFGFSVTFFDLDLLLYKNMVVELYNLIKRNYDRKAKINELDYINQIIDELEIGITKDDKSYNNQQNFNLSAEDILDGLSGGFNPFTGEVFEETHILNNYQVRQLFNELKKIYSKKSMLISSKEDLKDDDRELFEELRKWRLDKTIELGYYHAYVVFSDKELINIITTNIEKKQDLLSVQGIGRTKYDKYGDDIFNIIKNKKYIKNNAKNDSSNNNFTKNSCDDADKSFKFQDDLFENFVI